MHVLMQRNSRVTKRKVAKVLHTYMYDVIVDVNVNNLKMSDMQISRRLGRGVCS